MQKILTLGVCILIMKIQTIEYDPYNRYLLLGSRSNVMTVVDTSTLHTIKTFYTQGWVTVRSSGTFLIVINV